MLGFVKMSALSAVLSFGVVTAYDHAVGGSRDEGKTTKLYQDRIAPDGETAPSMSGSRRLVPVSAIQATKGDRLLPSASKNCAGQAWPHITPDCMTRADDRPKPSRVRVITVETREGLNTSVLQRVPQTDLASR